MAEMTKQQDAKPTAVQAQAANAANAAKDNTRGAFEAAAREGADALRKNTDAASDMTRRGAEAGEAAVREGTEALQQGGRAASDALRKNADAASDLTRRGAEAGGEAIRRAGDAAGETMRRSTQAVVESQRQIVQDAAEKFEEASRKIAQATQGTTENMRRFMSLPHAAEGGLRDFQQSMTGLVEGVVQTNLRVAQELIRMSNPVAIVELQQRFAREYMDTLMQGSATMVRAVRRTADETLRPLEEQARYRAAAE